MKLLSLRQQRASLELEVETLKARVLRTPSAGGAEEDNAADAADLECAARASSLAVLHLHAFASIKRCSASGCHQHSVAPFCAINCTALKPYSVMHLSS